MNLNVRTRFAPSPTGFMHIGNLRTALYEYLIAKKHNGKFILRIEDTDRKRYVENAVDIIYRTLKTAGIIHDEGPDAGGEFGPYIQSKRKDIYLPYAKQLVEKGHAYYCFCSQERLASVKENERKEGRIAGYDRHCRNLSKEETDNNFKNGLSYTIRQKMPLTGTTVYHDIVYGDISINNSELEDQVLIKSDGLPTYNFANVIDDHLMEITHVARGCEYITSTPKYVLLYNAFGWETPEYIHLPLITNEDGTKFSKRSGDTSFEALMEKGYLPQAVINYVALLGWSPGDTREIFSLNELEKEFDIKGISKSPSVFDYNKLNWMNAEYLRNLMPDDFYKHALPYIKKAVKKTDMDLFKIASIMHKRIEYLSQITEKIGFFNEIVDYEADLYIHKKMKTNIDNSLVFLKEVLETVKKIDEWTEQNIHDALMQLVKSLGVKNGQVLWPLRTALTGIKVSPGGAFEVACILGKTESISRIEKGIEILEKARAE